MSDQKNLCKLFRQMPVFGGLETSVLEWLLERSATVDLPAGEYLFMEGDVANSFFVIIHGAVSAEKTWRGTPIQLQQLGVGDCVGEMAIIEVQARCASIRAIEPCQTVEVTRETIHALYRQNLEQYAILMMNMGREVSRRLRLANERLFELEQSLPM